MRRTQWFASWSKVFFPFANPYMYRGSALPGGVVEPGATEKGAQPLDYTIFTAGR
jgi:hypothetical protein